MSGKEKDKEQAAPTEPVEDVEGLVRRGGRLFKPKAAGGEPITIEQVNRVIDVVRSERGLTRDVGESK